MSSEVYEVLGRNGKHLGFVQGINFEDCLDKATEMYEDCYSLHKVTKYPGQEDLDINLKWGGTD